MTRDQLTRALGDLRREERPLEASAELLTVLAERVRRVSELVEDPLFLNLPVRLAKKLVHYASVYGDEVVGGVRINL